jgi:hypothetical protein
LVDSGLCCIDTFHVNKAWSKMLGEGHFATIIEHCQARLAKALNDAKERKPPLIAFNPIANAKKPKVLKKEIRPLSSEQAWE